MHAELLTRNFFIIFSGGCMLVSASCRSCSLLQTCLRHSPRPPELCKACSLVQRDSLKLKPGPRLRS